MRKRWNQQIEIPWTSRRHVHNHRQPPSMRSGSSRGNGRENGASRSATDVVGNTGRMIAVLKTRSVEYAGNKDTSQEHAGASRRACGRTPTEHKSQTAHFLTENEVEDTPVYTLFKMLDSRAQPLAVAVTVNHSELKMEIDTGRSSARPHTTACGMLTMPHQFRTQR